MTKIEWQRHIDEEVGESATRAQIRDHVRKGCEKCKARRETREEIQAHAMELAAEDSIDGLCMNCESIQHGVEPDAKKLKCESCGHFEVYGAEEIAAGLV